MKVYVPHGTDLLIYLWFYLLTASPQMMYGPLIGWLVNN